MRTVQEDLQMTENLDSPAWLHPFVVADLPTKRETTFSLAPDSELLKIIADRLGLRGLRKLRFVGELTPIGRSDWQLTAKLGVTILQDCVVTLERVSTRVDETVTRNFTKDEPEFEEGSELEMPDDVSFELLGDIIDPGEIMVEALALVIPEFPKTEGAELGESNFTTPGVTPMDDAEARPFAGLKALQEKLENGGD